MLNFHIITLFPETIEAYLNASILGRAQKEKKIKISYYNPRDYAGTIGKQVDGRLDYKKTDGRPYGGGPGMVMLAEPVLKAVSKALAKTKTSKTKPKIYIFSPAGQIFDNILADKLAGFRKGEWSDKLMTKHIVLICGRYEGLDARVKKILKADDLSVGPYILTGGEVPAMIVVDAITRRLPGVLGKDESIEERRISISEIYTRPEVLTFNKKKYRVPKVLLSGHHAEIDKWKLKKNSL
ncbi:MAG: tRNA (guanosine(37)-N1)-methyltransferase TrmD [Candidatus Paceibacterota bacterium]